MIEGQTCIYQMEAYSYSNKHRICEYCPLAAASGVCLKSAGLSLRLPWAAAAIGSRSQPTATMHPPLSRASTNTAPAPLPPSLRIQNTLPSIYTPDRTMGQTQSNTSQGAGQQYRTLADKDANKRRQLSQQSQDGTSPPSLSTVCLSP